MNPALSNGELLREVVRRYVQAQRADAACGDGASTVRCHVLNELLRQAPLKQAMLVERLGIDKAWISRAVEGLVAEGLVVKKSDEQDRRSVKLNLTPQGQSQAIALNSQLNQHAQRLLARVPPDQQASIRPILESLLAGLKADTQTEPPRTKGRILPRHNRQALAISIRAAAAADWPKIKALLEASDLPVEGAEAHLGHYLLGFLQTDAQALLAGVVGLELYGSAALLRSLATAPDYRGQGVAHQLLEAILAKAGQSGVRKVYLRTVSAEPYFNSLGFKTVAHQSVPVSLRTLSCEFLGACPSSAVTMSFSLNRKARKD